jgi:hypothetical protein
MADAWEFTNGQDADLTLAVANAANIQNVVKVMVEFQ